MARPSQTQINHLKHLSGDQSVSVEWRGRLAIWRKLISMGFLTKELMLTPAGHAAILVWGEV